MHGCDYSGHRVKTDILKRVHVVQRRRMRFVEVEIV